MRKNKTEKMIRQVQSLEEMGKIDRKETKKQKKRLTQIRDKKIGQQPANAGCTKFKQRA